MRTLASTSLVLEVCVGKQELWCRSNLFSPGSLAQTVIFWYSGRFSISRLSFPCFMVHAQPIYHFLSHSGLVGYRTVHLNWGRRPIQFTFNTVDIDKGTT